MKTLKFLLMVIATITLVFTSCVDPVPPEPPIDPPVGIEEAPVLDNPGTGFVTLAICVPEGSLGCVTDGPEIVATGATLGVGGADDWSPENKANSFVKCEGKNTWYKITLPYNVGMSVKVVAVAENGTASWGTQWGMNTTTVTNITVVSGTVTLDNAEYGGEVKAINFADNSVAYVAIAAWKSEPCTPKNEAGTATFELSAPELPEGAEVGIVGNFPDKDWAIAEPFLMTYTDGKWTATAVVGAAQQYKYFYKLAGGEWNWDNSEDGGDRQMPLNLHAVDVVETWKGNPNGGIIPAGTGTFTITIAAGYVEGSDIIFTGNFETESWGDSQRVMTKSGDVWTWTGAYPASFQYKVIMRKAGSNDVWATGDNAVFDGETYSHTFSF
ncbi:MAG: hypothetical protein LBC89_02575 [Bacteroidales bacterium]|jgi:hypothetical protein|nr:hypothetical protein [Bacteroidales bacterium]